MKKKEVIYYLGLDMGTNSVGWAVTDTEYNLLRAKGKDLWGVREFEEAKTSAERRTYRTSRRRRQREIVRMGLVKNYFAEAINAVDSKFFTRLENSKYYAEDKDEILAGNKNGIFNDDNYKDRDYYCQYPTIFHLRNELIKNENAPYDVRLVYLAIINMFKHRGHFLLNGVDGEMNASEFDINYDSLVQILEDSYNVHFVSGKGQDVVKILGSKEYSRKRKSEIITDIFAIAKDDKLTKEFVKCLCGLQVSANLLFSLENEEKIVICFNDYSYADKVDEIVEKIGDNNFAVIESMKQLYDYIALSGTLNGYEYLSEARIDSYNKHMEDLKILKEIYRKYKSQEDYDRMFRSTVDGSYSAYVHSVNSDGIQSHKYRRNMSGKQDVLYSLIKKDLSAIKDDTKVTYVMDRIDKELFLPKQLTGANGIIPNQVHKKELVKILSNAEKYLPFLTEKDETGLSVSERIIQLFVFQIPYYIGPTGKNAKTGWAVRKKEENVLPWNISDVIDTEATSKEFIQRLIRECTFLSGEKVMPKSSLEYEKYCVLNEINNICIDGERIPTDVKQDIYKELFLKGKRVTRKNLCNHLKERGLIDSEEQITGVDVNINNYLSSYGKMYAVFGEKLSEDSWYKLSEEIIYWGTIYADAKDMYRAKLLKMLAEGKISEQHLSRLVGYKFKDWGRYSKSLLELEGHDPQTGEIISIIRALWEYPYNFNELISMDEFGFKETLSKKKTDKLKLLADFRVEDLDEYYFSSPVKRMIWQTISVIKEVEIVLGKAPTRVFIEMTRSDEEKGDLGRKHSRAKQLLECYKDIKDTEIHKWKEEISSADTEGKLKSKKLFLYYMQMGKDMYTGEEIDLDELFNDNMYDIDHIYPRHYVKDDSILNNLVLVNKEHNEHVKKDLYPIPSKIVANPAVRELWDTLHHYKLITDEKYKRLISREPFSDEQKAGFIARQLVETGQGTKGVADLLKQLLPEPNTEIVYSKAGNVSDFRKKFDFYKSRLLNEFHHANDAYLNIVVGNVYLTKFTKNPLNFIKNEYSRDEVANRYSLNRMFDWDVARNGYIAWKAKKKGEEGTIDVVRNVMAKNSPIITYLNYEQTGSISNATIYSKYKAKEDNYIPIKSSDSKLSDVSKYGGYTSVKPAYFIFIEHGTSKKRKKSFESIPITETRKISNTEEMKEYCEKVLGYTDVRIIASKIKKGALIRLNGFPLYISGLDARKQVEFHNAASLCLSGKYKEYVYYIEKSHDKKHLFMINNEQMNALYDELIKKHNEGIFSKAPRTLGNILSAGKEKFMALDLETKADLLYRILSLSSMQSMKVSLKEIGGPSEMGRIRISGNMTDCEELLIVNTTVAGITEGKVTDLLKS